MEKTDRYAVLIDSDNVSAKYVKEIFEEINSYGTVTVSRIYGDWTRSSDWKKEILLDYSISAVQQFSYTTGKNATDMAMVIDAMDILYTGRVDGFCLVTSDSDFTRLASRLRESNCYVLGMGESKTPLALRKACNKFILLNLISEKEQPQQVSGKKGAQTLPEEAPDIVSIDRLEKELIQLLNERENGMLDLAMAGNILNNKYVDFDPRNYGYSKLSVLVEDGMPNLRIVSKNNLAYVVHAEITSRQTIEEDIINYIKEQGGKVQNLSVLNDMLHIKHSGFDVKNYGYSRFSSFLRSIKQVEVKGNTVVIKKK